MPSHLLIVHVLRYINTSLAGPVSSVQQNKTITQESVSDTSTNALNEQKQPPHYLLQNGKSLWMTLKVLK